MYKAKSNENTTPPFFGTVHWIGNIREGTSRGSNKPWKSAEFVVKWFHGDCEETACFSLFGAEKVDRLLSDCKPGTDVCVRFSLSAREWNGRWYPELRTFDVTPLSSMPSYGAGRPSAPAFMPSPVSAAVSDGESEDLPF